MTLTTEPALCTEQVSDGYRGALIPPGVPFELATLSLEQVAMILQRSVKSIKVDVTRNPHSLPTIMRVPHSRKLVVRAVDMQKWMEGLAELERNRQRAIRDAARRDGVPARVSKRDVLGNSKRNLRKGATMLMGKTADEALAEIAGAAA